MELGTLGVKITADTSELKNAEKEARRSIGNIESSTKSLTKAQSQNQDQSNNMGRGVGQLGIQFGQLAGQIQGGQNALLAFSQQSSDILIVLGQMFPAIAAIGGLGGAIISIGSALAGSFLPNLFKSKDGIDELKKATEKLGEVAKTVGKDELVILTEEVAKLAQESENAARAVLRGGMIDAVNAMAESAKLAQEELANVFGTSIFQDPGRTSKAIEIHWKQLDKFAKKFRLSSSEANELAAALKELNETKSNESLEKVQAILDRLASEGNSKVIAVTNKIRQFSDANEDAAKKLEFIKKGLDDISTVAEQSRTIGGTDIDGSLEDIERLGQTEREAIQAEYEKREKLILASTQLTEEKRNELLQKSANDRDAQLAEITAKEVAAQEAKEAKWQAHYNKIAMLDETETERVKRVYKERYDWIKAQSILNEDEQTQLIAAARNARNKELKRIDDADNKRVQQNFRQQLNAMQGMANGFNQVIAATGEDGAARMAGLINGVAQTAMQIVSLMQAQATAQAAGDPTAMTLPQKIANVAAIASMFAGIISSVSAARGAGRQFGGMTSGNKMHEVNEAGVPELLSMGNRQFLMPTGQNGKVTPLGKTTKGSAAQVNVNVVNNAAGAEARAEQGGNGDIMVYVDNRIAEINNSLRTGRGDTAKNLQQGFKVQRKL